MEGFRRVPSSITLFSSRYLYTVDMKRFWCTAVVAWSWSPSIRTSGSTIGTRPVSWQIRAYLANPVFFPLGQPLNLWVMTDFSPCMARHRATGYRRAFTKIQLYLFRNNTGFNFAHFGMCSPSSKSSRRFHIIISDTLQMSIHQRKAVMKQDTVCTSLSYLFFFIRNCLLDDFLFIQMSLNWSKVAFGKILNYMPTAK